MVRNRQLGAPGTSKVLVRHDASWATVTVVVPTRGSVGMCDQLSPCCRVDSSGVERATSGSTHRHSASAPAQVDLIMAFLFPVRPRALLAVPRQARTGVSAGCVYSRPLPIQPPDCSSSTDTQSQNTLHSSMLTTLRVLHPSWRQVAWQPLWSVKMAPASSTSGRLPPFRAEGAHRGKVKRPMAWEEIEPLVQENTLESLGHLGRLPEEVARYRAFRAQVRFVRVCHPFLRLRG